MFLAVSVGSAKLSEHTVMTLRILVTGANGFVGRWLCAGLSKRGYIVRAVVRAVDKAELAKYEQVRVDDISSDTDWKDALTGVDVVIHLAARVHVMQEKNSDPLSEFRNINVRGTENLARYAVAAGVKRVVYVSSIKVNGEETSDGRKYVEADVPSPIDSYGVSKWEAEQALYRVSAGTQMEVVIVRPPLVYGPGVKGNFAQLLRVLSMGIPLPLSSVRNKRSLIYVENLVDALSTCATHPAAAGQTYLVSDGEDISSPELLLQLGAVIGSATRLFHCSPRFLEWAGAMTGQSSQVQRLLGSLQVDSGKIRRELNWTPPYSLQQGLQATAEWYRDTHL